MDDARAHISAKAKRAALAGVLLSVAVFGAALYVARKSAVHELENDAVDRTIVAHGRVEKSGRAMELLQAFFRASEEVTPEEFDGFAESVLDADLGVAWLAFTGDDGAEMQVPRGAAPTLRTLLSGGGDLLAEGTKRVQWIDAPAGPLLVLHERPFDADEEGRQQGELMVAIDLVRLLEASRAALPPRGIDLHLLRPIGGGRAVLASLPSRMSAEGGFAGEARIDEAERLGPPEEFTFRDVDFVLQAYRSSGAPMPRAGLAWMLLLVGLLCTAAVTHSLWVTERSRLHAERLVERRTKQLADANQSLERRVAERTDELEVAKRELETFNYSVSHDLRAPLRTIDGFARKLAEHPGVVLPSEARRLLAVIRESSQELSHLVDALLRLSRLGQQSISPTVVDLDRLVPDLVDELRANGEANGHRIDVGALGRVDADPVLLREVFRNLLENAIKFSRVAREPRVSISRRDEGEEVEFAIVDNGVGFDPVHGDRIFRPFERLHRGDEFPGTGIGLALCRRILERHGGSIRGEGSEGRGAAFRFRLPRHGVLAS